MQGSGHDLFSYNIRHNGTKVEITIAILKNNLLNTSRQMNKLNKALSSPNLHSQQTSSTSNDELRDLFLGLATTM